MSDPCEIMTLALLVKPPHEPVYSEKATRVEIVDESGGPFVEVSQCVRQETTIQIDIEEWPYIRAAIDTMIESCKVGGRNA